MRTASDKKTTTILSDHNIHQIDCGQLPPPDAWHSRRLYIHSTGAQNWCNVVHNSSYPLKGHDPYDLEKNRKAAVDRVSVATMISLGPGDAHHDVALVERLSIKRSDFVYIPVDLSRILLDMAIRNLRPYVSIPAGIQCDFEQIPEAFEFQITEIAKTPVLLSMLGGTIGNLDLGERHFFNSMRKWMGADDYILIDVPLAGPDWKAELDPRFNKDSYTREFNQFITFGLETHQSETESPTDGLSLQEHISTKIGNGGDVPNTKTVTIFDRPTGRAILRFRRYDWKSIVAWLARQGFDVLFHQCAFDGASDIFGMGVILLRLDSK